MPPAAPQATSSRSRYSGSRHELAKARSERRADLHDRSLPPNRAAGADAQCGGQRLHHGDLRADSAAALGHREHHLGHPMTRASRANRCTSGP